MTAEGYHLIAHCVNATSSERAEVEFEVASESTDGHWFTNYGMEVWPFWTQPIEFETPAIPEGWIDHLHTIPLERAPSISLVDALGLRKPKAEGQTQPVARRF